MSEKITRGSFGIGELLEALPPDDSPRLDSVTYYGEGAVRAAGEKAGLSPGHIELLLQHLTHEPGEGNQ